MTPSKNNDAIRIIIIIVLINRGYWFELKKFNKNRVYAERRDRSDIWIDNPNKL